MKSILQITIFLFSIGVFACECYIPTITQKYIESDFVADVTIIKIYPNQKNENGYRADIKINELFKGERLEYIYVAGRSDNGPGTSCDIFIPENTRLIAYAWKNIDGNYGVGMCSGLMYLDYTNLYKKKTSKNSKQLKKQKKEVDILNTFKENKIAFTDKKKYRQKVTSHNYLEQFKGIELDKNYGIYKITFATDLTIKTVKEVSGFGTPIDEKLIEILSKTEWTSFDAGIRNKVPDNSVLLIGFYYYKAEKGYPSFLSEVYL